MDPSYSLFALDDTRIDKEFLPWVVEMLSFPFSFQKNVIITQHYLKFLVYHTPSLDALCF